ncbi:MAG TPA: hypothetical protein V6C89_15760 [Drouetiella sp.]|jgi:hypothetical protein
MHHGGGGGAGFGHGGHHGGGHHGGHGAHHAHHGGAPSSSASWNMAMQADSFWVNMLKANSKPLLVVLVVVGSLYGWLCLLHYLHQKDSPDHVVSSSVWNQQLTAINPRQMPAQSAPETSQAESDSQSSAPAAFGSPIGSDSARSATDNTGFQSQSRPSLAPLMFSSFMPGGYQPQPQPQSAPPQMQQPMQAQDGQISTASLYAPASYGAPAIRVPLNPQQLFPARTHSNERYRMVVNR